MIKTAILVDGGFYRQRAYNLFGAKAGKERADELNKRGVLSHSGALSYA